ncbi:MAG: MlaD family protein [Acidobacteriia bacterium]|nr:MlaD family protein [Terriglobia bacterium]
MAQKGEEIKVGALAVVATVLFLSALAFVGGVNLLRKKQVAYTTYFKFAGGLEPGTFVRFGGLKVGAVQSAEIDPQDSTRIRVRLLVAAGTPVRVNSRARISTLGFLGENYVELSPGTRDVARLEPGSEIAALEIVQLAEVFNNVNNITVNANKLVNDIDDRFLVLADNTHRLLDNMNSLLGPENRQRIESALANTDALLAETRPRLKTTLANLDAASAKLRPTLDNANSAITQTKTLVGNMDSVVEENRQEIRKALLDLRAALTEAQRLMGDVQETLDANRANLDETLENIRASSQNLKQFTDTIKQRPFSLIRIKAQKDRVPPLGK